MCYPCRNCGSCTSDKSTNEIKCPKCGTVIDPKAGTCSECGWSIPLPPGQAHVAS